MTVKSTILKNLDSGIFAIPMAVPATLALGCNLVEHHSRFRVLGAFGNQFFSMLTVASSLVLITWTVVKVIFTILINKTVVLINLMLKGRATNIEKRTTDWVQTQQIRFRQVICLGILPIFIASIDVKCLFDIVKKHRSGNTFQAIQDGLKELSNVSVRCGLDAYTNPRLNMINGMLPMIGKFANIPGIPPRPVRSRPQQQQQAPSAQPSQSVPEAQSITLTPSAADTNIVSVPPAVVNDPSESQTTMTFTPELEVMRGPNEKENILALIRDNDLSEIIRDIPSKILSKLIKKILLEIHKSDPKKVAEIYQQLINANSNTKDALVPASMALIVNQPLELEKALGMMSQAQLTMQMQVFDKHEDQISEGICEMFDKMTKDKQCELVSLLMHSGQSNLIGLFMSAATEAFAG